MGAFSDDPAERARWAIPTLVGYGVGITAAARQDRRDRGTNPLLRALRFAGHVEQSGASAQMLAIALIAAVDGTAEAGKVLKAHMETEFDEPASGA